MIIKESNKQMLFLAYEAVKQIIPVPANLQQIQQMNTKIPISNISVLIGITGDIKGQMLFDGSKNTFSSIGEVLFGMSIGDEMMSSFVGELGNMIAGNVSTIASTKGISIDITPPTIIEGENCAVTGYDFGIGSKISFEEKGSLSTMFLHN